MFYDRELRFLQDTFQKYRLQVSIMTAEQAADREFDLGLRRMLNRRAEVEQLLSRILKMVRPKMVYKFTDQFLCSYLFLSLPDQPEETIMIVGPYLSVEVTREQLLEQAELAGVNPQQFARLEHYYSQIPVYPVPVSVFAPLDVFCERIWGGEDTFGVEDINQELSSTFEPFPEEEGGTQPEDVLHEMEIMETRYAYENELMQAVSQGLVHKAELMLVNFSQWSFERRLADPVRNLKNYCIIMNTLMRKAAEQGGVHPMYLHSTSSAFARKIETITSIDAGQKLIEGIFHAYCRLVRKHSIKQYSPLVQKAVIQIDTDLSGDLSLKTLAETQKVNASYLSTLFKKETGQTLTDYVNQKRVRLATRLLSTTKLQIQTIARHCGIPDVNYFTKIFKKYIAMTPKEYRASVNAQMKTEKR